jgi:hypothetical protein
MDEILAFKKVLFVNTTPMGAKIYGRYDIRLI